eukprot:365854-Chlamydomonas_euryale.AAC.9
MCRTSASVSRWYQCCAITRCSSRMSEGGEERDRVEADLMLQDDGVERAQARCSGQERVMSAAERCPGQERLCLRAMPKTTTGRGFLSQWAAVQVVLQQNEAQGSKAKRCRKLTAVHIQTIKCAAAQI